MHSKAKNVKKPLIPLALGALGVVFGDIGTSPLYTIREALGGPHGFGVSSANVLGVLSLVFWALIAVVTLKYVIFVLRADNHGEGGILSLMALVTGRTNGSGAKERVVLVAFGIFGAALLYGDGTITPAITVLSAVEGLNVATDLFTPYLVPITMGVLLGLFLLQRRGTARIGRLFGPFILVWFFAIGTFGAMAIIKEPGVLMAINPLYGLHFFAENGPGGLMVLGAIFLAVTGGEALYADLGHFGRMPIRVGWMVVAMPALFLNYFGQGAILLKSPEQIANPFFALVPPSLLYPMVALSTIAAVIASQAVITGAFSLTSQAIMLGFLPRMRILHTSSAHIGQIYVPTINFLLMIATMGLVLGFRSSSNLAAAYGVAVSTTMLITTVLLAVVMRERWNWSPVRIACTIGPFAVIDIAFWLSTMVKVPHGGWFPLAVALIIYTVMSTWRIGRVALAERFRHRTPPIDKFVESVFHSPPTRVEGTAVYMSSVPNLIPPVLLHNLKYNKILHEKVVFLCIVPEERPYVPHGERLTVRDFDHGIMNVTAHFGFMESPCVPDIVEMLGEKNIHLGDTETGFYVGRKNVILGEKMGFFRWRIKLFRIMTHLAQAPTAFYRIPSGQVVEIGVLVEL